MNATTPVRRDVTTRAVQLLALGTLLAAFAAVAAVHPPPSGSGVLVAASGLLLLSGVIISELLDIVRLPHLTGYIAAGVMLGPHVLHFIDHQTVVRLEVVNSLALALIALAGGLELRVADVRIVFKTLAISNGIQTFAVLSSQALLFMAVAPFVPFAAALPVLPLLGVCLLWGVLAVSRSPSATLAILSQTHAKGPVTRFSLAFVMSSDVVVVVLMAVAMTFVRPLIEPAEPVALSNLRLVGHELLGSVSIGTTLGLVLIAYLRLIGSGVLVVLVAIGFALSEVLRYLSFEPLLTFLTAGFVVQNLSSQGEKLLRAIENTGSVVFVVFFATAGAHLDLPLLSAMWPVALALCGGRFAATWLAQHAASRLAGDPPSVRRWGFAGLVSQAGLTLGLSAVIARAFPALGDGLKSLIVATVAINEIFGPILFKFALERSGEAGAEASGDEEPAAA